MYGNTRLTYTQIANAICDFSLNPTSVCQLQMQVKCLTQMCNSRLWYLGLWEWRKTWKRGNEESKWRKEGRRGNRNNRERGLNDKVSVKVWGRRQNEVPRRSRFLADKLWKCCCRPAPVPRVAVSRRLWPPCWAGLSTLLVRTSRKEAFGFLSEGRKSFFLFLNVHCFWNWMETNTEREERINTQPAFAKLSVPSNQYFFEPTTLSNNQNVLVALFGVFS